jgi:hypothetical protein
MVKRLYLVIFTLALFAVPSFASGCPIEGQHVSGGGAVSYSGRATMFQQNISGCFVYITYIKAALTNAGGSSNFALGLYSDQACTTNVYQIATLSVPNTMGETRETTFEAGGSPVIARMGTPYVCVGWNTGFTGVVQSVYFTGYFSGNL